MSQQFIGIFIGLFAYVIDITLVLQKFQEFYEDFT